MTVLSPGVLIPPLNKLIPGNDPTPWRGFNVDGGMNGPQSIGRSLIAEFDAKKAKFLDEMLRRFLAH